MSTLVDWRCNKCIKLLSKYKKDHEENKNREETSRVGEEDQEE